MVENIVFGFDAGTVTAADLLEEKRPFDVLDRITSASVDTTEATTLEYWAFVQGELRNLVNDVVERDFHDALERLTGFTQSLQTNMVLREFVTAGLLCLIPYDEMTPRDVLLLSAAAEYFISSFAVSEGLEDVNDTLAGVIAAAYIEMQRAQALSDILKGLFSGETIA